MEYIDDPEAFRKYIYQKCHCINAGQTKEERRLKYAIVRSLGKSPSEASRLKDWRKTNVAKRFGYSSWKNLIEAIKE